MSAAAGPQPVELVGFLEAVTGTTLLGWAWAPRAPAARLTVQAWLGEQAVAEASADRPREDLARNGVGDGSYAFALDLPEALRGRGAELAVTARLGDGPPATLAAPPVVTPADAVAERLDRLQRGLDAVMGAQRVLHRTLQAAVLQPQAAASDGEGAALAQRIVGLEVIAMRLDERLAALAGPEVAPGARTPRAAWAALGFAVLALVVAVVGMVGSVPWSLVAATVRAQAAP
jgi:hypothetical protein